MAHRMSLSRAAHLVGVHRSALQKMIREGRLAAEEGMVTAEELMRAFPRADLQASGAIEWVNRIKEESFGRRVRERMLPSQEVLAQRLFSQGLELAGLRRTVQRYHALLEEMGALLREGFAGHPAQPRALAALSEGIGRALAGDAADDFAAFDDALRVMTPRVEVRPSGREFFVEGHDSILQSGLKAGLRLSYGCGNGTCGLCRARVVDGEVQRIRPHDFPLSEAERAQGHILMCAYCAVTDVKIETLEAAGPEDIPRQEILATVRAVSSLGEDTRLLHLQAPRSNRLRFLAGQSASLGAASPAGDLQASYPIASCPCDDRNLHFHVGRDEADPFAAGLFSGTIRPGERVTLVGPEGNFVLAAESARPQVFAACDLGFAPVKSLVEYALSADTASSFTIAWLATRRDGHYLANQCRAWAEALDDFAWLPLASENASTGAAELVAALRAGTDLAGADVYVAGPEEFVRSAEFEFRSAGVPAASLAALAL
ncbi:MAG: 2Fe-2S iron-sulfur cluster-binding protein [Burkholderiales bacterium]